MEEKDNRVERIAELTRQLMQEQRLDLLYKAIGAGALEKLNIEAARATLSPLTITADYRFLLPLYKKEVEMEPIHKALYMLFLNHPEGIEFKQMPTYRDELLRLYERTATRLSRESIATTVSRLCNPLDNAINEKCSRIKAALAPLMNPYQLQYYIISSHTQRHVEGSTRVWFERRKSITLPRTLVTIAKA